MKKKIFIFCFLFGFVNLSNYAQKKLIDSLITVLKKETNVYRKIDIKLGLTRLYSFSSNHKEAQKQINEALGLLDKQTWDEALIIAYTFKAVNEVNLGNGSDILYNYLIKAQNIANNINSNSGKAIVGYHLAEYYIIDKNNPKKGKEKLLQTLKEVDYTKAFNKNLGNIYKNLGNVYTDLGDTINAVKSLKKSINYFDKGIKNPLYFKKINGYSAVHADKGLLNKAQALTYIAGIDLKKAKFENAKKTANKAAKIFNSLEANNFEAWSKSYVAFANEEQGNLLEAIKIYKDILTIYEKSNNRYRLTGVHLSLGNLFLKSKSIKPAENNYKKALSISLKIKDSVSYVNSLSALGKLNIITNNLKLAKEYLEKGFSVNNKMNENPNNFNLLSNLAEVYLKEGNFTKAIATNKQIIKINNKLGDYQKSLNNLTNLTAIFIKTNQLDSAYYYANKAQIDSDKYASLSQKIKLNRILTDFYEKKEDYKQALKYYRKSVGDSEKSFKTEAIALLKNEQVRQDVAGIKAKRTEALLRNKIYITLAIILSILLIVSVYLFFKLRKNKKQLESKNQQLNDLNNTKDKFFGIIAHDIRSPIVALDGVGEQMDYHLKNNNLHKLERLTDRVDSTAKKLSSLLDNLLNWALFQQGVIPYNPETINVYIVCETVLEMFLENANAKQIQLTSTIKTDIEVFADEASLNTILRNLISNAIKFTEVGGAITVSTETKNKHVFIKINDTGTGISAKALTSLFNINKKSKTGTSGEQGTGLGLNLVKELIELNKGKINVNSNLGIGSEFVISLPIKA